MVISDLRTKVRAWTKRTSRTDAQLDDLINAAMHLIEDEYNFRRMKNQSTGTITSSTDYIALPTNYKCVHSLFLTVYSQQKVLLEKYEYKKLITEFSFGDDWKTIPEAYSTDDANSRFLIRPYPDDDYDYELNYYKYSNDLSDSNTSNFWLTTTLWDLLLWRTLLLAEGYGKNLPNAENQDILTWKNLYDERLSKIINVEIDEVTKGSYKYRSPNVVV